VLDKALAGKSYLGGNDLSAADAAVFYVEFWGAGRLGMKLPANVAAHYERIEVASGGAAGHAAGRVA